MNQKLLDFLGTDWGESEDIKDEAHGGSTKVVSVFDTFCGIKVQFLSFDSRLLHVILIPRRLQTAEEMQLYTIGDDLDDAQRVELFLGSSLPIQQCCGLVQLPSVVRTRIRLFLSDTQTASFPFRPMILGRQLRQNF